MSGILPIDQMRDHIPPVSLVASRIPRLVLEETYGIRLPHPREGEDPDRPPYAEELCGAYGCKCVTKLTFIIALRLTIPNELLV